MRLIKELHRPDLAMVPIGGHYTMDPPGARWRSSSSVSARSCPLHYGTFPILAGTPAQLRDALSARGSDRSASMSRSWRDDRLPGLGSGGRVQPLC
jgi:L-ascorbate metabolism protein UlaG (beta-lactamase superfamily)